MSRRKRAADKRAGQLREQLVQVIGHENRVHADQLITNWRRWDRARRQAAGLTAQKADQ